MFCSFNARHARHGKGLERLKCRKGGFASKVQRAQRGMIFECLESLR